MFKRGHRLTIVIDLESALESADSEAESADSIADSTANLVKMSPGVRPFSDLYRGTRPGSKYV